MVRLPSTFENEIPLSSVPRCEGEAGGPSSCPETVATRAPSTPLRSIPQCKAPRPQTIARTSPLHFSSWFQLNKICRGCIAHCMPRKTANLRFPHSRRVDRATQAGFRYWLRPRYLDSYSLPGTSLRPQDAANLLSSGNQPDTPQRPCSRSGAGPTLPKKATSFLE